MTLGLELIDPLGLPKAFQNKKNYLTFNKTQFLIKSDVQFKGILELNLTDLLLRGGKCVPWTSVTGESHFVMIPLPESIGRALFFL